VQALTENGQKGASVGQLGYRNATAKLMAHKRSGSVEIQVCLDIKRNAHMSDIAPLGYCSVLDDSHTIDPSRPTCPAFKEVGDRLGPFTLGLIPIGAYDPRPIFSPVHNAPIDAVRMFQDTVRLHT
jgi:hypothetical protein